MLDEIFYWVFNMSIAATVTGIIVMLVGKIKRIPRRFVYVLWIIPFLRMLLPVGLGSNYSLMSLISKVTTKTIIIYEGSETFTMMNSVMAANSYFPITYKVNMLKDLFCIASMIWIIISVAILIALGILYSITRTALRNASHLRDNVYLSNKITSPAVYGIFRPKIILPSGFESNDLTYILLHENAHIRNADNLWRIIAFITTALHWFNPFSWVFLRQFLIETELFCDERVLAKCEKNEKKAYALTLVDCVESKNIFASAFGGAKIRVRLDNILSYKKLSAFSAICFIALTIAIAYVLLTNAL